MKALIIVIHDHHFLYLLLIYMEKMNFLGALCALLEYFREKKLPQFQKNPVVMRQICNKTKLSLSNIMKHGESDVERQISIQSIYIYLSAFLELFL